MSFSPDLQTLEKVKNSLLPWHHKKMDARSQYKWLLLVSWSEYWSWCNPDLSYYILHCSLWYETTDIEYAEWNKSKYFNLPLNSTLVDNFTCETTDSNPDTNFLSCLSLVHSFCMSSKSTIRCGMFVTEYKTLRKGDALIFRKKTIYFCDNKIIQIPIRRIQSDVPG